MKPHRFEPYWISIFGLLIAPIVCGLNVAIVGVVTGRIRWKDAPLAVLVFSSLSFWMCFPLGLWSQKIRKLWQSGQTARARWMGAGGGLIGLFCLWCFFPNFKFYLSLQNAHIAAACFLPILWVLCFFVFAVFARPPKP